MQCHPRNYSWYVIRAHAHWRMASNTQYTLPPQSSLQESASGKSRLRLSKAQKAHSQRSLWLLVVVSDATRMCYGARLFEEEAELSAVSGLPL